MRRLWLVLAGAIALTAAVAAAAACGDDDDDLSDIRGSATAAATQRPTEVPTTAAPGGAYVTEVRAAAETFTANLDQFNEDLLAAETNQADPSIPAKLGADIELVKQSGEAIKALEPPADLAGVHDEIAAAVTAVQDACDQFAEAIQSASDAQGAAAFLALSTARARFDAALARLP